MTIFKGFEFDVGFYSHDLISIVATCDSRSLDHARIGIFSMRFVYSNTVRTSHRISRRVFDIRSDVVTVSVFTARSFCKHFMNNPIVLYRRFVKMNNQLLYFVCYGFHHTYFTRNVTTDTGVLHTKDRFLAYNVINIGTVFSIRSFYSLISNYVLSR